MNEQIDNNQQQESNKLKVIPNISPVTAAFLGLVIVFVLYQFGGAIISLAIFGLDFKSADITAVRLLTMGSQILFILFPALLLARFFYEDVTSLLRVRFPSIKEILIFIAGLILLTPLLQSYLYIQNFIFSKMAESSSFFKTLQNFVNEIDKIVQSTYGNLLEANSLFEASFIVFIVAVIPALCEEIFFRGFVQKSLEQKFKPIWSAIITSIFFGIYHFNPYGLLALIALGVYFGFAAYKSNSIFIPMVLHFLNNFFAVVAFLIFGDDELISSSVMPDNEILPHLFTFGIILLLFMTFIFFVNKNYYKLQIRKGDK